MIARRADRQLLLGAAVQDISTEEDPDRHLEGTATGPEAAAVGPATPMTTTATGTDVEDLDRMSVEDRGTTTTEITGEEIIQVQAKKSVKLRVKAPLDINKEIEMTIGRGLWKKMWRCKKKKR